MVFLLSMADFCGPLRWRWLLAEEDTGRPLADQVVDLDARQDEYVAFTDLYRYLRRHGLPDRRAASETEIVARVGDWAGREVLGEAVGNAIVAAAPVTVRVVVPEEAGFVAGWPLELAHAMGVPLASRGDVTFAYDLSARSAAAGWGGRPAVADSGPLRMLAVFSLPTQTSVLALRRERYELGRLIRRIRAHQARRVELVVAQYGVTRRRLAEIAESGAGWDALHLSGHGGRGQFWLEKPDGSPDPVDTGELLGLLAPLRRRVRLAVVSACESAAATTAETLRWVGLDKQADEVEQQDQTRAVTADTGSAAGQELTGIARALVEQLECAVVAMRYPVTDEFAIALAREFYERTLGRGQQVSIALARAIPAAAGPEPSSARPAICVATPMLVGTRTVDLALVAPAGPPELGPARGRMGFFPLEPERFVGRVQAMAQASAALASESGRAGILLHGMAGSGKTACALELAYRHQDSFEAVAFWRAPEHGDEFAAALASLAAALEAQLGGYGFAMSEHITTSRALEAFLPRLAWLLGDNGILLVLDNLETLLTGAGAWRDRRWAPLIGALTMHGGESRVILTSRIPPAQVAESVLVLPVHALSLDESAALARELPHLRGLLHADAGPLRDAGPAATAADRDLVRRVLRLVQGHPTLMGLANAAAADPARLAAQLTSAEAAADGQTLEAFFRDGMTGLSAAQLLDALTSWTTGTLTALSRPARLMAQFLVCLEDGDRLSWIVEANWADLWSRLGWPGAPPAWPPLITEVAAAALVQVDCTDQDGGENVDSYQIHPGVATAIRAAADPGVPNATDAELADFWYKITRGAMDEARGERAVVVGGVRAAPYLLRLREWDTAGPMLESAIFRDSSPTTVQAVLPFLRAIADASEAPAALHALGRALASVDLSEAERQLREALERATGEQDFRLASVSAGDLVNLLLRSAGRLGEALDLTGQMADYSRRAGLGPWTQLADQGQRLQILGRMGEHQQVLDEISGLRARMDELPIQPAANEIIDPWKVRESILSTGFWSAVRVGEWQRALDFNQAVLASLRARGASDYQVAHAAFNDARPLGHLGRFADAEHLLASCQDVFEAHDDLDQLGSVFAARAWLEAERGNPPGAVGFQKTAIRYHYLRRDPQDLAADHYNLANFLHRAGSDPAAQRAHRLAAALIYTLTGMTGDLSDTCAVLASELHEAGQQRLPGTVPEVIAVAEQTKGVQLGELIAGLVPDPQNAAAALAQIMDTAASMPTEQDATIQQHLRQWEPVIAVTVAAAGGDRDAAAEFEPILDRLAGRQEWATLVAVLRRILAGERGEPLLEGLDPVDTTIAGQVLARLAAPAAGSQQ